MTTKTKKPKAKRAKRTRTCNMNLVGSVDIPLTNKKKTGKKTKKDLTNSSTMIRELFGSTKKFLS